MWSNLKMTRVNNQSKQVIDKLWELSENNNGYYKLNNDPTFMSLTVEILESSVISLCHYGEQNGDLMRDPEMLFWKDNNGDYFPYYFRNDYMGIEIFTGEIIDGILVITDIKNQNDQSKFSNRWLLNIKYQQNII
jgi:hypothetical protein